MESSISVWENREKRNRKLRLVLGITWIYIPIKNNQIIFILFIIRKWAYRFITEILLCLAKSLAFLNFLKLRIQLRQNIDEINGGYGTHCFIPVSLANALSDYVYTIRNTHDIALGHLNLTGMISNQMTLVVRWHWSRENGLKCVSCSIRFQDNCSL
jgi:hypothetical protein